MSEKRKSHKLLEGQVLRVDLKDGTHTYARVLKEPLMAFYDELYRDNQEPLIEEIVKLPVGFRIWVMNYAVTRGVWPVIGLIPLTPDLKNAPRFFKQDAIDGQLAIYQSIPELAPTYERPATYEECRGLEAAAVWDPSHVEERLRDHFAHRPNKWVGHPKTPEEFEAHRKEMQRKREARKT